MRGVTFHFYSDLFQVGYTFEKPKLLICFSPHRVFEWKKCRNIWKTKRESIKTNSEMVIEMLKQHEKSLCIWFKKYLFSNYMCVKSPFKERKWFNNWFKNALKKIQHVVLRLHPLRDPKLIKKHIHRAFGFYLPIYLRGQKWKQWATKLTAFRCGIVSLFYQTFFFKWSQKFQNKCKTREKQQKALKTYFDEQMYCTAPACWLKYATERTRQKDKQRRITNTNTE